MLKSYSDLGLGSGLGLTNIKRWNGELRGLQPEKHGNGNEFVKF